MHKRPQSPCPPLCASCHTQGRGCCFCAAEGVAKMFGLTRGECLAITQPTGLALDAFSVTDQEVARSWREVSSG